MARIKERPSSVPGTPPSYRVQWRMGGRKGKDQSCTMATEADALAAKALVEARRHRITDAEVYTAILGLNPAAERAEQVPTLGEWAKEWIAERRKLDDVQADTLDEYVRVVMRRILPELGHVPLTAIGDDKVMEWLLWLRRQPSRRGGALKPNTIRRAHSILHSLLAAAVPKWLDRNPCAKPAGSRKRNPGLPKVTRYDAVFLTPDEIELVLTNCSPRMRTMAFVAVRTGLRLGELLVLRVEDVTITGRRKVIRVRRARKADGSIGTPKSARSWRDVSISAEVAEVIAPLLVDKKRADLIFTASRGGMWIPSNLHRRYWAPALAAGQRCPAHPPAAPKKGKTGPPRKLRNDEVSTCDCPTRLHQVPRWHDLRHTHVSLLIEAGWQPVRVQRRIGHESLMMTMDLYGHLWETDDADRLDAVEQLLKPAGDRTAAAGGRSELTKDERLLKLADDEAA